MKTDTLKQFLALRQALEKEKDALQARLVQIDRVLAGQFRAASPAPAAPGSRKGRGRRPRNKVSLRQAVIEVTRSKALTKPEILAAIAKLGYRFAAKNPVNSLNTVLYTKNQFKNASGRFSPAKSS